MPWREGDVADELIDGNAVGPIVVGGQQAGADVRRHPLGLFDGVLARGAVRDAVGDRAWLAAMLDFEAALARAEARAGIVKPDDAAAIERACRSAEFDVDAIARAAVATGNPVPALVRALGAAVGEPASALRAHALVGQSLERIPAPRANDESQRIGGPCQIPASH